MKQSVTGFLSLVGLSVVLNIFVIVDVSAASVTELVEDCLDCHGKDGASTEPEIPIIGGISAQYIIDSAIAYKDKARPCPEIEYPEGEHKGTKTDMCHVVDELSEEETQRVAEYFADQPFVRARQPADPEKARLGARIHERLCEKCHEDGGSSPDDDAGILAGQWKPYLEGAFKEYASGKRSMPEKMQPKMDKLDKADTEALIHFYISFQ